MRRTKDGLSRTARNKIRYREEGSERAIARKYGISEAMVREIRATAQRDHPVRKAASTRREADHFLQLNRSGRVSRSVVPATVALAPKGQLHVEGGADLPQPLR